MTDVEVEVREFVRDDFAALLDVFSRAGEGAPTSSLWGDPESEAAVYLTPYIDSAAGTLLVAVVDGSIVGYLAGCDDDARFPSESERMDGAIRQYRLWLRPRAIAFFLRATVDVAAAKLRRTPTAGDFADPRRPAHVHINVIPEARGTGAAQALMQRWLRRLADTKVAGCYLQTVVENSRAVAFFTRMGFAPHGSTPVVPGVRHQGRRVHQLTMTWSPPESSP